MLLLGFAPAQRELAFFDARLVAEAVEQVPAKSDRSQPIGAAPIVKALPIHLENCVNTYLGQKVAARRSRLVLGQAGRQLYLASLRPLAKGVPFVVCKQALREFQRCHRSGQGVRRIKRQAKGIVQCRAGHVQIGSPADLLLADTSQVNADREHVDIGGHSCGPHRLRTIEVSLRRPHGLAGRIELLRAQQRVIVGPDHARDHFHLSAPALLAGNIFRQLGRAYRVLCLTCVVERLIGRDLRLKIVEEIGPIQWPDLEVLPAKLMLRQ